MTTSLFGASGGKSSPIDLSKIRNTKAQREILDFVQKGFDSSRSARLQFERQWYVNLAFYYGKQNVQWQSNALGSWSRLWEPPVPPWRVRLVSNKIRSIMRKEMAKVTKEKPQGFVVPSTSDDDDVAAARAGERIIEHIYRVKLYNKLLRQTMFWTLICGTGFIKDWYDPNSVDESGIMGNINMERVTPFHIYIPDVQEEELENQPFLTHAMAKSPDFVYRTYDVEVQPDSTGGAGLLEQKFLSAIGLQKKNKELVVVRETWVKPCRKFPDGGVIHWTQDEILAVTDNLPFEHQEYPLSKIDHIPTGRFYGESTIVDLIPLQKEYNRTRSQIIESKNRMSKPQLIAPRGSVDPNKITSEPGLIIFYTPGFTPPQPLPLTPIPGYVIEELNRCQTDMDDISSQHETSRGSSPTGVSAATAISYLQEEDDTVLAGTIASLEEATERIGHHILCHVQQFWVAERKIQVVGDNNEFESFTFANSNIKGNTDFKVESGSAMPRSKAAKQAFITELGKMGWIPPDKALRYLDMAETGRLYEEMQIDAKQAQRENVRMMAGQDTPVNTWDSHLAHIQEHDNFRKRQQFETLPEDIKQIFEEHVSQHKQLFFQEQTGGMAQAGDPRVHFLVKSAIQGLPNVSGVGGPQGMGGGPSPGAASANPPSAPAGPPMA